MQFKSFMEALKGKQHKIDKNKNGEIDSHDFKLLRKEDTEESNESFDFNRAAISKQKLQNLRSSGRKVRGASVANLMRASGLREEELDETELDQIDEVLSKDASAGDWIKDFVHSTNPKFDGKSKKERMNMALGAYYSTHKKKDGMSEGMSHQAATTMKHIPNASDKLKQAAKDIKPGIKGYLDRVAMLKAGNVKEQAPVAPVPDRKYIKGTPENKALKDSRKPINGHPTNVKEEAEQIDELSKGTLGSYIKKAKGSAIGSSQVMGMGSSMTGQKTQNKAETTVQKRATGINKAVDRLTKEEIEQIEERSDQAKQNKTMKNMMDASRGARFKLNNPVPDAEPEHKTAQAHNKAIGRSLRNEATDTVTKDASGKVISFKHEGDWKKTTKADAKKDPAGKVANMAGQAMKKMKNMSEEKDEQEYGYEGDMALNQLATLIRCAEMIKEILKPDTDMPEWVQSKITLATDYIQTAADYMHSEMNEAAAVTLKVNHAGDTPHEEKWEPAKKIKKAVRESFDDEGNLIANKVSYKEFMLEYTPGPGGVTQVKGRSYGASYTDPEGADDYDDKKPMKPAADKRGRGRPAGAKSGARKIMGTSKLTNK